MADTLIRKGVGAKAKNYDIVDPATGNIFHFVEGTRIQNSEAFAGYGTRKPLDEGVPEGLADQEGGIARVTASLIITERKDPQKYIGFNKNLLAR